MCAYVCVPVLWYPKLRDRDPEPVVVSSPLHTIPKLTEGAPKPIVAVCVFPLFRPTPPHALTAHPPPNSSGQPSAPQTIKLPPKGPLPAGRAQERARGTLDRSAGKDRAGRNPDRCKHHWVAPPYCRHRISNSNGSPGQRMRKRHWDESANQKSALEEGGSSHYPWCGPREGCWVV